MRRGEDLQEARELLKELEGEDREAMLRWIKQEFGKLYEDSDSW